MAYKQPQVGGGAVEKRPPVVKRSHTAGTRRPSPLLKVQDDAVVGVLLSSAAATPAFLDDGFSGGEEEAGEDSLDAFSLSSNPPLASGTTTVSLGGSVVDVSEVRRSLMLLRAKSGGAVRPKKNL